MKAPLFDDGAAREETLEQANVALANEINKRKQSEAALREQAQLLELTHNTIMVRSLDNTITFWNHGAEELYGWTKAEALGKSSHTLLQTEYPQPLEELESALLEHGRWEGELIHTRRDGTRAVVASRWALKRDEHGLPLAVLEINNDITERKRMEQELQESAASIRALYQLSRTAQLSFEERCQQLLAMGCRQFQLDFGILVQVEGERCNAIAVQFPDSSIAKGYIYDLRNTFYSQTLRSAEPVVIDANTGQWQTPLGYAFPMKSYFGMQVVVAGKVYGVLCFCSPSPCPRRITAMDKELLKLMAQWVGGE